MQENTSLSVNYAGRGEHVSISSDSRQGNPVKYPETPAAQRKITRDSTSPKSRAQENLET